MADRAPADAESACELRGVEQTALMVCEHGPQSPQRLGRDARAQLRYVALEVGADEVLAPAQADRVVARQEAVREAAPDPELVQRSLSHLGEVEGGEFNERDPPGQALAGLGQQVDRGGAQQQEPPGASALAPGLVDHAAQRFEQARRPVDLIEDDELPGMVGEVQGRLRQASAVSDGLQVQIDRWSLLGDRQRERGLAGLSWAEDGDGRRLLQQRGDLRGHLSLNHPYNYRSSL